MRRASILLSLLALAAPAAARADLTEAPFAPLGAHRVATCLRATGAPGEVALSTQLWSVTRAGAVRADRVTARFQSACAVVAGDPGGAAVAAVPVSAQGSTQRLLVAVRAPGGRFAAPVEVARSRFLGHVSAAVNARGDAVVAWIDARVPESGRERDRVRAVRWPAGGHPAAPAVLQPWSADRTADEPRTAAGIDAAGGAVVAFRSSRTNAPVQIAGAAPGRPFGAPEEVPGTAAGMGLALAVAPDGRTLVTAGDGGGPVVAERPPGARTFSLTHLQSRLPSFAGELALAVAPDGAAVLAWRDENDDETPVFAATRGSAGAPFSSPRMLWQDSVGDFGLLTSVLYYGSGGVVDDEAAAPRALLTADGRAAVAWVARGRGPVTEAWLATGTAAGGLGAGRSFGSPVRDAEGAVPVALADGAAGLAWADDASPDPLGRLPAAPGRLHVAVPEAVAPADQPAPAVRLRVAPRLRLYRTQGFRARVRCAAPCDVLVRGGGGTVARTLEGGVWRRLPVGRSFFGVHPGRVPVTVTATAPGGARTATARAQTVVTRRPPPPVPQVIGLGARRAGGRIVVTWRTDRPARRTLFLVRALATRRDRSLVAGTSRFGRGRLWHRGVIRPADALGSRGLAAVRWVALDTAVLDRSKGAEHALVPLR